MPSKSQKSPVKPKKKPKPLSLLQLYGYTHRDFKKWGKSGGRTKLYQNNAERMRAYRLRKKLKDKNSLDSKPFSHLWKKYFSK